MTPGAAAPVASPQQLGVSEFGQYALIIDARSPHEYAEDHLPGAINLPVVDDDEYAEVGIRHKTDKHGAYLIGVEYSLRNIADQIKPLISKYSGDDRFLVYCFRGGKRSRLWADNLRTIGFEVDQLAGGWKRYRQWVRESLATLPGMFNYEVLAGPTGCGKTRLLSELARQGEQVLDMEELASHRGSLLGKLPGRPQPTQKMFDTLLLASLRKLDPARRVWIEAESKKIGERQLPDGLFDAMHRGGAGGHRCAVRKRDGEALRPLLRQVDEAELWERTSRTGTTSRRAWSSTAGRGSSASCRESCRSRSLIDDWSVFLQQRSFGHSAQRLVGGYRPVAEVQLDGFGADSRLASWVQTFDASVSARLRSGRDCIKINNRPSRFVRPELNRGGFRGGRFA